MTCSAVSRFASLLLAAVLFVPAWSQQSATPQLQQTQQQPTTTDQEPIETLKINVNVVNLFFNVKDGRGALVPALTKGDFQVLEEGKPQTIKYFTAEVDQPLTLGILIDASASQQRVLPMEQDVGAAFLRGVLRPKDLAFLISFDVNVDLLHDFTNSARELNAAMQKVKINTGGSFGGPPGLGGGPVPQARPRGTLLYDAIYLAADEKLGREVGRKAMIVLTDGEDQGSQETIKNAIEAAQRADAICYVLLIADRGFYGGFYGGDRAMRELTEQTGGRMIDVGKNEKKLQEAFDQIAAELRTQYSIGYTPTNQTRDGSFRKVEIKVEKSGLKVQSRAGYYAPLSQ